MIYRGGVTPRPPPARKQTASDRELVFARVRGYLNLVPWLECDQGRMAVANAPPRQLAKWRFLRI
jgi:hypothetical protein